MDLRNLTDEEFLMLEEEEGKASINIGRRPHPSVLPGWKPAGEDDSSRVPRFQQSKGFLIAADS